MNYILQKFKDYCDGNGIKLMHEDLKFIEKTLQTIPIEFHSNALRGYIVSWRRKMAEEKDGLVGINSARREANQFLLFFTEDK